MKRPITPRGYRMLRDELRSLKAMRPELSKAIEVARGHGDLSENADYDAAKEKSGMVEAKIRDLDTKLSMAEVIDPRNLPEPTKVVFGVTVSIEDLDSGESKKLTIVGADESNAHNGWISIESPLGKSLIGKEEGDVVKVKLPGGAREYEVMALALEYEDQGESDDE